MDVLADLRRQADAQAFGRELRSLIAFAARLPEALVRRVPGLTEMRPIRPPAAAYATPVILVHGYLGTQASWAALARRLHDEGFANVYSFRYDALSAGIADLAAALIPAAATAMARTGQPGVHLVGHSLGGLLARYAVQRLGLDRVTRSVVTVATPHEGSPLARLAPGTTGAQLRPGSVVLDGLPALAATGGVRWAVIHAGADVVVPAAGHGDGLRLAGYGHLSILNAPALGDAVVEHLVGAESTVDRSRR